MQLHRFLGSFAIGLSLAPQVYAQDRGAVPSGSSGAIIKQEQAEPAAPKPQIVPPELVHMEPPAYPVEAQNAGISGTVILKITIDREGNVTRSEVSEGLGHGLDEAAQAAALKCKFKPATRDGKAIPAQIPFRYSFTLTVREVEKPAPTVGILGGNVRLAGAEVPIAGAIVVLQFPDGHELRLRTDAAGHWELKDAPPGAYQVKVEAEGYNEALNKEEVAAGEETQVTYRLAPKSDVIEILVQGERPPREVTRRTVERREIERIPGTSGDALRSLQSLPGVARPPGLAGLLIVRGSSPNDTQVFVDGTLVPLAYHFGGLSSIVPTELLDRIDFYPGNFSARYGRVQGGIVDVALRKPDIHCNAPYGKQSDKQGCYHGLVQFDLIDGRVLFQGPIGNSKEWSFAVAGRRSWVDAWLKPALEQAGSSVTTAPVYYDYQAILERNVKGSRLSFRGYGADDQLRLLIKNPSAQDPGFGGNLNFGTSFYRLQVLYEAELTKSVSSQSMLSIGRNTVDFSLGQLKFSLDSYPFYARHEFGFRLTQGAKLNTGLDFLVVPYDVLVRAPDPPRPGEPASGPFVSRPPKESKSAATFYQPAWYVEAELQPTDRLRIVPGLRLDYARNSNHTDFSPRLNMRYDLFQGGTDEQGEKRLRTTLKGGGGYFHQPPQPQETDQVFGTPNLQSNRALHYSLGIEQEFSKQIELSVEGFYKDLTRQISRSAEAGGYLYGNLGLGYVQGLEMLLKYKPDQKFFGWIAYTLSRSVRQNTPTSAEYLFQYDQTHNLIMLGSYRLGRGWEVGARFRLISGPLVTPVSGYPSLPAMFVADAGSYVPLQGAPFSRRLPFFHQLDLRVDKRWQFENWRLSAYLDVQNAYNNAATEQIVYDYNYSHQSYQTGLPIVPSLGLRGEF